MEKTLRNKTLMSSYLASYGKGFLVICLRADRSATSQKYFIYRLRVRYEGCATRKAQEVLFKCRWRPSCCLEHRHYCSTLVSIGAWDTESSGVAVAQQHLEDGSFSLLNSPLNLLSVLRFL